MAWYCSASTNTELVENLFKVELIKNERVKEAMLGVSNTAPRHQVLFPLI
jgi:protein-L-isoaspartate(D-aspartate) O-methyltransferase